MVRQLYEEAWREASLQVTGQIFAGNEGSTICVPVIASPGPAGMRTITVPTVHLGVSPGGV